MDGIMDSVQRVAESSESLREQAQRLTEGVSRFRLPGDDAAPGLPRFRRMAQRLESDAADVPRLSAAE